MFAKKLQLFFILSFTLLAAGCGTSAIMTRSADEILSTRDSRLMRGRVDAIMTDKQQQQGWEMRSKENIERLAASGVTQESDSQYQHVSVRWYSIPGNVKRQPAMVHRSVNIQVGDIVDIYSGAFDEQALRNKDTVPIVGAYKNFGIRGVTKGKGIPYVQYPMVVGVVCRADEKDCKMNSRPGTEIGIGRKMADVSDYKGVEAESKQEMYKDCITLAEFLSINRRIGDCE